MNATTVAVDLAKSVFQLVVAHNDWKPVESHRQFGVLFNNRAVSLVIMEACGSAHHWARGIEVRLLEVRTARLERELSQVARHSAACARLLIICLWLKRWP